MYYVIHTNVFKEHNWNVLMDWVKKYKIDYEILPFKPFVSRVKVKTTRKDVWCWGSVSLSKIARLKNWKPGSMLNDNHDYEKYMMYYQDNLLSWEGEIMYVGEGLPDWAEYFFARPTKDSKVFSGELFSRDAWNDWVKSALESQQDITKKPQLSKSTRVLIAPIKPIEQEIRCWVVGGKVVTTSLYKLGSRVTYKNYDHETYITDFAQKMVDLYQPADAFVIDVCLSNGELKVIEINCINCAGFYDANMNKLMDAVETYFNRKYCKNQFAVNRLLKKLKPLW